MIKMKIKELRGNETQKELCQKLNLSIKNLSNYEVGRTEPDIKTLIKLADYFNVSLDYLCDRQWNNQVGYIPDSKKNTIQKLLELDDMNFERVDTYINARLEVQNEQHYNKKAEG